MKISILNIGKTDPGSIKEGVSAYLEKLRHYHTIDWMELPAPKGMASSVPAQLKKEEDVFIRHLGSGANVFLLDSGGKEYDSIEFAGFIGKKISEGQRPLILVTGGPYGFSERILQLAEGKISFSKLTFTHQMIRLILAEQLYRAFTIRRNERYHH